MEGWVFLLCISFLILVYSLASDWIEYKKDALFFRMPSESGEDKRQQLEEILKVGQGGMPESKAQEAIEKIIELFGGEDESN